MFKREGKMIVRHFQSCIWLLSEAVIFAFLIALVKKKNLSCYHHCSNKERAGTEERVRKECSPVGVCLCGQVQRSEKHPVHSHYPERVCRSRYRQTPELHVAAGVTSWLSQLHMGTLLQTLAVLNSSNMSLLTPTAKESEVAAWTETCKLPHRDLWGSIVCLLLSNVSTLSLYL